MGKTTSLGEPGTKRTTHRSIGGGDPERLQYNHPFVELEPISARRCESEATWRRAEDAPYTTSLAGPCSGRYVLVMKSAWCLVGVVVDVIL